MDYAACNIVYVDRTAPEDKLVRRDDLVLDESGLDIATIANDGALTPRASSPVDSNVRILLSTFSEVHVCASGKACISKLSELDRISISDLIPTLVLIEIPYEDQVPERPSREVRTPSPSSKQQLADSNDEDTPRNAYGLRLLQWIASEIQCHSLSKLVVPVAVVSLPDPSLAGATTRMRSSSKSEPPSLVGFDTNSLKRRSGGIYIPLDQRRTMKFLDVGALDVLTSPLLFERLPSLAVHAYRAHKDALKDQRALIDMKRGRKRSWVGYDDQKPYAYLREAMVSGLMDGICRMNSEEEEEYGHLRISVALERRELIFSAIGSWNFSAHDFTDDELLHAALLMLQHALSMPELEKWRISAENITGFLVASRAAYNSFVPYHNFRHVVDVLQAIFHFLVRLGRLPHYPLSEESTSTPSFSPVAELIRPFDALTLMITAIGHDVGHPGVNNAFLVTLNAPLAQLYNDRSVLESFHCAAYSQILRRHWPAAFHGVEMRRLMIDSILATDMGLHFDYMRKLGQLQEKLFENGGTDGWNGRTIEEQRTLACSLLIKCADISNVARRFDVASKWTEILTDEFARQAAMEQDLGIPSALYAAPVSEIIELGNSQIGFINMFAIPLFTGVTDVMPAMRFCVEELERNKATWEEKIALEQEKVKQENGLLGLPDSVRLADGMRSPRTMSVAQPADGDDQPSTVGTASKSTDALNLRIKAVMGSGIPGAHHNSVDESPKGTKQGSPVRSNSRSSHNETNFTKGPWQSSIDRRSSKPRQLQLSYATASAPQLLDHPSQDVKVLANGERQVNGVHTQPSLVTDLVVVDPPTPKESSLQIPDPQRSSDTTTEGSNSAGDWTSQEASATTSKMPISPSTQATSFASEDSAERTIQTPTFNSPLANSTSRSSIGHSTGDGSATTEGQSDLKVLAEGRNLKKKPSRFRMKDLHFWKRSKSGSPPMPAGAPDRRGFGASDESGG